jgi:hypothetical protein
VSGSARKVVVWTLLPLVAGATMAGVLWGPELAERFGLRSVEPLSAERVPSPELADTTLSRLEEFQRSDVGGELRLGEAELSSLVRYTLPGILPVGVTDPNVELRDGRVVLGARVAVSSLPELPALNDIVGLLPDTIQVEMEGTLQPLGEQQAALHVDRMEASRIPLPARLFPEILRALGRRDAPGLPPNAIGVPLPRGLSAAFVRGDTLVLVAR